MVKGKQRTWTYASSSNGAYSLMKTVVEFRHVVSHLKVIGFEALAAKTSPAAGYV